MARQAERIGLFGGSFDPVHVAHLALARTALDTLGLDRLHWVPTRPWQKAGRELAADEHRAAMVALAIDGEPRYRLDRRELRRTGPSYTVDTVCELHAEHPGAWVFLLLGQDQYANLHTWKDWQSLLPLVTLAVAARDGRRPEPAPELAAVPHRLEMLAMPRLDVSATDIRTRLARGEPASALVPSLVTAPVARYIDQHRLYAAAPTTPRS
ncbi:nicotinate-nucleotide adenylyltransferase [Methylibium rhizosphaerae]|uniref:nicotinate-nucleotide adenylyltransferase n=1 Tax=Methylibium rhizosphaerae TaxID=2570323 RepID=UPI0015E3495C|nr:nicotinate-nucleotide adenylyltransferase [Methylibium rhizosphaerae]